MTTRILSIRCKRVLLNSQLSVLDADVQAARALYAKHSVEAITRNDAGALNLSVTSRRVEELVDEARAQKRKIICFVTGVL